MRIRLFALCELWLLLGIPVMGHVDRQPDPGLVHVPVPMTQLERFNQADNPAAQLQIANEFFRELYDEQFIDTLLIYGAGTPVDTLCEQVWYWAAEYCYDHQQYDQADTYARKAMPLFQSGYDRTGESDCLNLLAITNTRRGRYEDAIYFAKQCYRLDEEFADAARIAASLNSLTAIYMSADQPAEAEQYVRKGLEVAVGDDLLPQRSVLLGTASELYHALGDNKQSLAYAEQGYELELRLGREFKSMVRLSQKASALLGLSRYEEAERVLSQTIPFFRRAGDRQSLGISCNKMGMALLNEQREMAAVHYFREAAEAFMAIGDKKNEMHARKGLYESLWESHPDSARIELERFNCLKDSLYQSASAESLARFNAEFGNDWLKQENEAERAAKRHAVIVGSLVAVVLLFFSILVWWIMRKRQRRQAEINHQLSANIEELRNQYKELSIRYDHVLLINGGNNQSEGLVAADREFLEKTINVINEQIFQGQVDAESVAAQMNMSLFQLRQRLTLLTGETPQSFIAIVRMKRARYLLDNRPELNISEVAQLCAYNDTPNFTRAFKKTFGITPTQYLEKKRQQS